MVRVVVVVVVVVVMVVVGLCELLLLMAAGILAVGTVVAAPLGRADIGVGVVGMAAHCCSPEPEWS
jgi:hypothetical protein